MFFTHAARFVAIMAFIAGLLQLALGLAIATEIVGPYETALARYTDASSSGMVIDGGLYRTIFAIAIGTLAEISLILHRRAN